MFLFLFVCVLLMKGRCHGHEGGLATIGQCSDGGEIARGLIKARNLLLRMRSDHEIGNLMSGKCDRLTGAKVVIIWINCQ